MSLLNETIEKYIDSINLLFEDRFDYLLKTYGTKIYNRAQKDSSDWKPKSSIDMDDDSIEYLQYLEGADPTSNKQYLQWLVLRYIIGNFKFEDIERIHSALENFTKYKNRLPQKDINQYKGVADIEDAIDPFLDKPASKRQEKELTKNESEKIYDDGNVLVVIPRTEAAACFYGKGTRWCTAADENNMFNEYAKDGDLVILIDKKNNRKYQFHLESDQFMNERDESINIEGLKNLYPTALKTIIQRWHQKSLTSPYLAFMFVTTFIKKPSKEFESIIATDAEASYDYARHVLTFNRFELGEKEIVKNPHISAAYAADILKKRWLEAESAIAKQPYVAINYATNIIKGRFLEAEKNIYKNGLWRFYLNKLNLPSNIHPGIE